MDACPKNQTEAYQAWARLGCRNDEYGNIQYLCLPNREKTSLVEFCYDGVMGLHPKGIYITIKTIFFSISPLDIIFERSLLKRKSKSAMCIIIWNVRQDT